VNTHQETKVERPNSQQGVLVLINHPFQHPNDANFIAIKSLTAITIKPTAFSTSDDVKNLHPDDRQCYYQVRNLLKNVDRKI
jgi:hypothetical protein